MQQRKLQKMWITAYADALEPISEAPKQFTIWSAISVISATLKNNVWIKRGTFKIYPNQYIVLVGPPGVGKGSSIHPAHDFIKKFTPKLANYISDRTTAPKIIEVLANGFMNLSVQQTANGAKAVGAKESSAVLMALELPSLLNASDWMLTFLCDAWDRNEYEYGTKNKGSNKVDNMCVSLIGACVPDFIRKLNKDSTAAVTGGFTARTIFVFATEVSKHIPWPVSLEDTQQGIETIKNLREDLEQISRLAGEFKFSDEAVQVFEQWYKNAVVPKDDDSEVVKNFKSRQATHVFKVAMCFSAGRDDSLLIDAWCLKNAIAFTQSVCDTLDITFRGVGESSLADAVAKVQLFVEKRGMVTKKEIQKAMHRHVTMEDLERVLYTLESIDFMKGSSKNGVLYYTYTNGGVKPKS